jgi:Acetyltransferase (GNAT) domain
MQETTIETLHATNPEDAERWNTLVRNSAAPDVYYLPAYAWSAAEMEQTEPVAIVAGSDSCRILAPLLIRRMSAVLNGSRIEWLDASSPYGYGGLLSLSATNDIDAGGLHRFLEQLHTWCSDHRVVCCVLRLHPLMRQENWFMRDEHWQKLLRVRVRGSTSAIDLSSWDTNLNQPNKLRRDRRADLRHASRSLRVTWAGGEDHDAEASLGLFSHFYEQMLDRHSISGFLRFSPDYFLRLAGLGQHLGIAFAWFGDEPVGANIFLAGWIYAHGHLAGTNETGRQYGAATLLIVEGARWARRCGCALLHLGGGIRPGDSLEEYKRSFGGPSYRYAYVTYVADPERFDQLCQMPNAPWPYSLERA